MTATIKLKAMVRRTAKLGFIGLLSGQVMAVGVLPPELDPMGQMREYQRRQMQIIARLKQLVVAPEIVVRPPPTSSDSELSFVLQNIRFTKSEIFTRDELVEIVSPYMGKDTGFETLNHLVQAVNVAYRNKGILSAEALLPQQDIVDGTVIIQLVEGKLGNLLVEGNRYIESGYVREWIRQASGKNLINAQELEVDMTRFNRVNDAQVYANARAGTEFGLTDIVIVVEEPQQNSVQVFVDNYGYESSGEYEFGVIYRRNGVFTGNDRAYVYAQATAGNVALNANYNTPYRNTGWRFGGGLSASAVDILTGDFKDIAVEGTSYSVSADATWLAISEKDYWVNATGSISTGISETSVATVLISDYATHRINLGVNATRVLPQWRLTGQQSIEGISTENALVADSQQNLMMLSGSASATFQPKSGVWYGLSQFNYQYTDETGLPGALAFSLGGPTSIRGFKPGIVSGDTGAQGSVEVHKTGIQWQGTQLDPFVFYDVGSVWSLNPTQTAKAAGVGISWSTKQNLSFDVTYAKAIEEVVPNQAETMVYGRVTWAWGK
jgi:hemolysin activation/secretion protein